VPTTVARARRATVVVGTLGKGSGSLRAALTAAALRHFVDEGRRRGLLVALAGALTVTDLAGLALLEAALSHTGATSRLSS